jgi:translation initiation factor IF-3
VKINHIHDFLHKGSPVRIIIKMRGRERSHPELAAELLNKVLESLTESEILNPVKKSDGQLMVIIKMSSDHGKNEKSFGNNGD